MEPNMISHLNETPYRLIESGTKTIEMRLNDEKRQKLKKGDILEFINRSTDEVLFTKVKAYVFSALTQTSPKFISISLVKPSRETGSKNPSPVIINLGFS